MKRTIIALAAAVLLVARGTSQDFGFGAPPGGPGGAALANIVSQGPTGVGPGFFGPDPTFSGGVSVAAGDFNGDGIADIATTQPGAGGGTLTIFSGEGDGTFGLPVSVPIMNQPISIAIGDLDMDGLADVAVAGMDFPSDASGQLDIFSGANLSSGTPNPIATSWLDGPVTSISIGRIDGDAFPDIAAGLGYSDGSGALQTLTDFPQSFPEYAYNDSFTARTGKTYLAGANHTRYFESAATDVSVVNGGGIAVGQIGGVTIFQPSGSTLTIGLSGQPGAGTNLAGFDSTFGGGVQVAAGDFNNDDIPDLFTLNGMNPPAGTSAAGSGLNIFMGASGRMFGEPLDPFGGVMPGWGRSPFDSAVADFNADGFPDIAVAGSGIGGSGGVTIIQNNGGTSFGVGPTLPITAWPNVLSSGFDLSYSGAGPSTMNILGFCQQNAAACGGGGFALPGRQNGVTAGTHAPSNALNRIGRGDRESRPFDLIQRLGRLLGGLLTTGTPQPLAAARYSVFATRQMRAQAEPKQVIITATGASSGDFFRMEIIDSSGESYRGVLPEGLVLEPVAVQPAPTSGGASVTTQRVDGFCLDFAKDVPAAGTRYRIANASAQAQAAPMRNVLAAAKQMALRNLLHGDGTPGYVNFIRQYAVWAKKEGWDLKTFGESFVERTKQNVLSMKANWTDVMEQGVRAAIPGRWRDIEEVLRLSNQIATPPKSR